MLRRLPLVVPAITVLALGAYGPSHASTDTSLAPSWGRAAATDTVEIAPAPPDWQQEVGYTIEARLDEEDQVLRGAAGVRYRNASPDTLRSLYFHLYLNAFRPHSIWARNEKRERLDFGALEEPHYGYERLRSVRLLEGAGAEGDETAPAGSGRALEPVYPHAPDSTVVRLDLPEPLAPGQEVALHLRWDARPATLCRRQCREGRSWDLAQWYPRVAVYDGGGWQAHPLYPQGEFYGEFATYDVTLDLAADQVVGATGVPVSGDPGWTPVEGSPRAEPLYQRDHYGQASPPAPDPGFLEDDAGPDRKRVRFRAERVHHFAWSTSPEYRYEGDVFARGDLPDVAVHVLYRPGDTTWDDGVAVERTIRALSWLQTIFRPYPYPQITNLHRLEGGGTEFPMLIMDGSASEGLIVHEMTHQYAHGILANNEWKEAWLDEGLTSFIDGWYAEEHGRPDVWDGAIERIGQLEGALSDPSVRRSPPSELSGYAAPGADTLATPMAIASRSEAFPNYSWYGYLSYSKPQAVFYMLREMLGKETMRRILHTYYDRYEFRHVNEAAFRSVASEVAGRDLDWFFDQWLHTTATLDWSVASARTEERTDAGGWRTVVEVRREGEAWMPVTLRLTGEEGRRDVRLDTRDRSRTVEVVTPWKPSSVTLDPGRKIVDVDRSNDSAEVGTGG